MAKLQNHPSTVIQSSSVSWNTLFNDSTRERTRNHTQQKWRYLVRSGGWSMSCFRAVGTHLWVQISKVPPKLERALVELALKRLQPPRIGFLCQRHFLLSLWLFCHSRHPQNKQTFLQPHPFPGIKLPSPLTLTSAVYKHRTLKELGTGLKPLCLTHTTCKIKVGGKVESN